MIKVINYDIKYKSFYYKDFIKESFTLLERVNKVYDILLTYFDVDGFFEIEKNDIFISGNKIIIPESKLLTRESIFEIGPNTLILPDDFVKGVLEYKIIKPNKLILCLKYTNDINDNVSFTNGLIKFLNIPNNFSINFNFTTINDISSNNLLSSISHLLDGIDINEVNNLLNILNNKSDINHTHGITDIINLQQELNNLNTIKADKSSIVRKDILQPLNQVERENFLANLNRFSSIKRLDNTTLLSLALNTRQLLLTSDTITDRSLYFVKVKLTFQLRLVRNRQITWDINFILNDGSNDIYVENNFPFFNFSSGSTDSYFQREFIFNFIYNKTSSNSVDLKVYLVNNSVSNAISSLYIMKNSEISILQI